MAESDISGMFDGFQEALKRRYNMTDLMQLSILDIIEMLKKELDKKEEDIEILKAKLLQHAPELEDWINKNF